MADLKVVVCGGRNYSDEKRVAEVLRAAQPRCVIQGGARGADRLARLWAADHGVMCVEVLPNWGYFGPEAGPIRNGWMMSLNPDIVIAFPGGLGTRDMVSKAEDAGVKVLRVGWGAEATHDHDPASTRGFVTPDFWPPSDHPGHPND